MVGVITLLGYIIAFGGIYIFVGQYIVQNVLERPAHLGHHPDRHDRCTASWSSRPVVLGLKFGVRTTVVLYAFEVVLLLALAITVLAKGGAQRAVRDAVPLARRVRDQGHLHRVLAWRCWPSAGSRRPRRWPRRPATRGATCRSR